MEKDEEKRRIGREIKNYLARNRISREQFCFQTKLGKSTVDKLITGIFSEATLQIVLERTNFVRSNSYAAKRLGEYARSAWIGYLREFLFLRPSLSGSGSLDAIRVAIEWDEDLPGMVLVQKSGKVAERNKLGALWIPHSRSPLIYIHPPDSVGISLMVSTMVGEPVMRGIMMTVRNVIANAYVPIAFPIILRRLDEDVSAGEFGVIEPTHPKHAGYLADLQKNLEEQFGQLLDPTVALRQAKKRKG